MKLLTEIIKDCSYKYGSRIALRDEYSGYTVTFRELYNDIMSMAGALQHFGVVKGTHVAMFSENCSPWFCVDRGIMMAGGVSAVRGSLAPKSELEYIIDDSKASLMITDHEAPSIDIQTYIPENISSYKNCDVLPAENTDWDDLCQLQ